MNTQSPEADVVTVPEATGTGAGPTAATTVTPAAEWELEGILRRIIADKSRIALRGGGSKVSIGSEPRTDLVVSMTSFRGLKLLDRARGLVRVKPGLPVHDLERELLRYGFMLPFEPPDLGPLFGLDGWRGSIGGAMAANIGGSRSLSVGMPARSLRAATLIDGLGETVQLGHPVGTRRDRPDRLALVAGSWGIFGVMTEFVFEAAPLPEETVSLALTGLTQELAVEAMAEAVRREPAVTGAAYLDRGLVPRLRSDRLFGMNDSLTLIRLEGGTRALPSQINKLREHLDVYVGSELLTDLESAEFWSEVQALTVFQNSDAPLWRIAISPSLAAGFLAAVRRVIDCTALIDQAGGVIWLETFESPDAHATDVRRMLANFDGAATLVRAGPETREQVPCFHPLDTTMAAWLAEAKAAFDPGGIFNPGRLYDGL